MWIFWTAAVLGLLNGVSALSLGSAPVSSNVGALPSCRVQPGSLADYEYRKQWYAIGFEKDMPKKGSPKPLGVSIWGEPFVIYRDAEGELIALEDSCVHRKAKLSHGLVRDGLLECTYHGWKFNSDGSCVGIPQLAEDAVIPKSACVPNKALQVSAGTVYMFLGSPLEALAKPVPTGKDNLDDPEVSKKCLDVYSFVCDLPYSYEYLLENLCDPAHIPVSHDRTRGGGMIEDAQPLMFNVSSISQTGVQTSFYRARQAKEKDSISWVDMSVDSPGIIRYRFTSPNGAVFGSALHCVPLAPGRCRLLFRTYVLGVTGVAALVFKAVSLLRPTWVRHLNSCKVLEQDVALICSQEDMMSKDQSKSWADEALALKSSDAGVIAIREWLDGIGPSLPFYEGWSTRSEAKGAIPVESRYLESRYHRRVVQSRCTRNALRNIQLLRRVGVAIALGSGFVAALGFCTCRVALGLATPFVAGAFLVSHLEKHFFMNFERHAMKLW